MGSMKVQFGIISRCLPELLIGYLDVILSVIFLLGGAVIVVLSYTAGIGQYGLGFAFLSAPFGYTLARMPSKNHGFQVGQSRTQKSRRHLYCALDICFWALYSVSSVVLYHTLYFRPWYYFLCVSVAFAILVIQTLFIEFKPWNVTVYFLKIVSLSLSYRAGRFFAFPTIPGSDTHFHLIHAKYISDFGYVPPFEIADKYAFTPLWHIYETIYTMIFDAGMAQSLFFLASSILVVTIILIYVIGKNLFNSQVGLMASVFVSLGDMIFVKTVTSIDTSLLIMVYFLVLIFCLHYTRKSFYFIAILMIVTLFWTHQLSAFAVYLTLLGYYVCDRITSSDYFHHITASRFPKAQFSKSTYLNSPFMAFSTIYMIFFWSLIGEDTADGNNFFEMMIIRLVVNIRNMFKEYSASMKLPTTVFEKMFSHYDLIDSLFYNLGYSMLFCLALIGALLVLKYCLNGERVSLLSTMVLLFVIIYPGTFIGLDLMLLPDRFLPFFQFISIIFAAFSLVAFYRLAPERISHIILTFFTLIMIFFLITAPYANRNDPIYSKSMEPRTEIMHSELAGISWGQRVSVDNHITVDPHIGSRVLSTVELLHLDPRNITNYMSPDESDLYYIRSHIRENPDIQVRKTFGVMKMVDCTEYLNDIAIHYQFVYNNSRVEIYDFGSAL